MKKVFLLFCIVLFWLMGVLSWTNSAYVKSVTPVKSDPGCQKNYEMCTGNLTTCTVNETTCNADLAACEAAAQVFPGDGYGDGFDLYDTPGHGPALHYTDNDDGTFTDDKTGYIWEKKLAANGDDGGNCQAATQADRSVHCVNNFYTWTDTGDGVDANPDGTLFTVFLYTLNNTCRDDETIDCHTNGDTDCGVGGACGFAGHRDWCIPNIKKLQSIVDYSTSFPARSFPGSIISSFYWSATTDAGDSNDAWFVDFGSGGVSDDG